MNHPAVPRFSHLFFLASVLIGGGLLSQARAENPPLAKNTTRMGQLSMAGTQEEAKPVAGSPMGLQEFMQKVSERNGNFKSISASRDAAVARRLKGDLELSPVFTASGAFQDDKKPQYLGSTALTGTKAQDLSVGLAKKFSTGTQAQISAGVTETETSYQATTGTGAVVNGSMKKAYGALGVSLSQSLWKDFFGNATGLRRDRESMIEKTETRGLDLQSHQVLIEAEGIFWDHVYLKEELRQRQESLNRARRIENWMKGRVSNGIGDRADLLTAQGLSASRELQLLVTADEVKASEKKVRDALELAANEALPELSGNLQGVRSPMQMVESNGSGEIVRLDAYLSVLEAQTKTLVAREVAEGVKPDLILAGSYKTNSVEDAMSGALSKVTDASLPTAAISLKLTYLLDSDVKDAARRSASLDAMAAREKQGRKLLESKTSWSEIQRRHQELSNKIVAAEKLSQIQVQKADAERERLSRGRTITSTAIQAEQDAAEAQLTLAKLRAEQRKLEAQGRLFLQVAESELEAK